MHRSQLLFRALLAASLFGALIGVPGAQQANAQGAQSIKTQSGRSSVTGSVFDSVAGRPVWGARVQLASTTRTTWERSVVTDISGAFRFDSVAIDSYLIGFYAAAADSIGLEPPLRKVDVVDGKEVRVSLAIPSARSIIAYNCRGQSTDDGLFLGVVRSATDRSPVPAAKVRVRWVEMAFGAKGLEQRAPYADATTTASGNFALCGIPNDPSTTLQVRAWSGVDSSGYVDLEVPRSGLLHRDMYVGKSKVDSIMARTNTKDSSKVALPIIRGDGSVRGTIKSDKGRPINNAHISVGGTGIEATSQSGGEFSLTGLPSGTYAVESRAIGYLTSSRVVDITADGATTVDLVAVAQNNYLDTVRILGERTKKGSFDGFDRRREAGIGKFLTESQIKEMQPLVASDLFRSMRGVFVTIGSGLGMTYNISMRSPTLGGRCRPSVFVDHVEIAGDIEDLDKFVSARDIIAVEVYNDWASAPAEYMNSKYCGTIVMWTKIGSMRR